MAYVKKPRGGTPDELRHAARAAADTGADIVKTAYPGSAPEFERLCFTTPVPVLIGGGERMDDEAAFFEIVRASIRVGGAGICVGRNLFQRKPLLPFARRIGLLLHGTS
jgi:DhnA family fructose-bisphosphate aldolase class Ia